MESLKALFSDSRVFRIPDYQRGYAWENDQLEDLWDDITDIQKDNKQYATHYCGTICVEEKKEVPKEENWLKGVKHYDIVDGQQRLTTLVILIHCLLSFGDSSLGGEKASRIRERFLYEEEDSQNTRMYKLGYYYSNGDGSVHPVIREEDDSLTTEIPNRYSRNLQNAKVFFQNKIGELGSKEKREELYDKLVSSLMFDFRDITQDGIDVQMVFETMNNRGKQLTVLEKLKNRLMFLSEKIPAPQVDRMKLRREINNSWGMIYRQLGANPDFELSEDEFLAAHLTLYRTPIADYSVFSFSIDMAEKKVFKMFCNHPERYDRGREGEGKEDKISYTKIREYVNSLTEFVPKWVLVNDPKDELIQRILLLKNTREMKVFLCAVLLINESRASDLFQIVEQILFRNATFSWVFDDRAFANEGRLLYEGRRSFDEEKDMLQKELIDNPVDVDTLCSFFSQQFAYTRMRNTGYIRWPGLKYFLFEYEKQLLCESKEEYARTTYFDYLDATVEHIIPVQYADYWSPTVESFLESASDNEEGRRLACRVLINTLGNLTILRHGKNSSLGNKPWIEKKARFRTGSYNEIEVSDYHRWQEEKVLGIQATSLDSEWDKNTIKERGEKMIRLLFKKLGCANPSESIIHQMLFSSEDLYLKAFDN